MTETTLSRKFIDVIPRGMCLLREELRTSKWQGLSTPQLRVLLVLDLMPSTSSEISHAIGVSLPSLSRMVDGLVRKGFVRRVQVEGDRRQVRLELSGLGKRRVTAVRARAEAGIANRLRGLSPSQRRALLSGLRVIEEVYGS